MKFLILCSNYPTRDGGVSLNYIHIRNIYYVKNGAEVVVINFYCKKGYLIDGVKVISLQEYTSKYINDHFDLLICHAANIKYHLKFLIKYGHLFPKYVFFFHGHEVLKVSRVYPPPYEWEKSFIAAKVRDMYDIIKLKIWHFYYKKIIKKSYFIFVSNWMLSEFEKWIKISRDQMEGHYSVIYNCVSNLYEERNYDVSSLKKFDFVTIRSVLDGSKYCIDLINTLAENNPQYSFLLIGRGSIFNHINKANNIIWIDTFLGQEDIINFLNQSRVALMPTRCDAQGVMMCEMATFGIPVITSDIKVCIEVFDSIDNVYYIKNEECDKLDLTNLLNHITSTQILKKNTKFTAPNTLKIEYKTLKKISMTR
jgi:glycosyltransferase involved in cell wall biosynthesis